MVVKIARMSGCWKDSRSRDVRRADDERDRPRTTFAPALSNAAERVVDIRFPLPTEQAPAIVFQRVRTSWARAAGSSRRV